MTGFRLFTSNRLETLADKLTEVLASPLAYPLTAEVIVVQSLGMARWLAMEIARRQGICANVRFPFPRAFVEEAFSAFSGANGSANAFTPEIMTWKLMRFFPRFLEKPGFERIRHYLEGKDSPRTGESEALPAASLPGGAGLRRFQLASRVAYLFDQYLIFRPEMMNAWEEGKTLLPEEQWQAALWQALAAGTGTPHPAARRRAFLQETKFRTDLSANLPERVAIFGISALPRFYLDCFHALAEKIEVNLFLLNPSREFWGDIRSDRERERELARLREASGGDPTPENLYLEGGNRLLASLGSLGREFHSLICDFPSEEHDFFQDPPEDNLLACLQGDILDLRDRGQVEKKSITRQDRSLCFQDCHSPWREVEALYDNLLALFTEDKDLLPRDILVMAPDIGLYAPLIKAVFDKPSGLRSADNSRRLPFTIADRGSRTESYLIDVFMRVLDMAGSRYGATEVLSLLELPEIGAKFGISPGDGELIRRWVKGAGIRWGLDGENRHRLGLPPRPENTWQAGLERLLMGYAVPGKEGLLPAGILPYDLEGNETAVLGKLLDFTGTFFPLVTALNKRKPLSEWSRFLEELQERLLAPRDDAEGGRVKLRETILRLRELEEESGFREPLDVSVIMAHFRRIFAAEGSGSGFLAGGVTCCSMLPMRSIPFPVICLLGMNGADYPRCDRTPTFDLIAKYPQPGDRSRRKDDRYLFLEALFSARKKLIISYVGRSNADNSLLPPSVLVTELLDYLDDGYTLEGGGNLREHLLTRHRLQGFSPAYFQGTEGLFTYDEGNWRAACARREKHAALPAAPLLTPPAEDWRNLGMETLVEFCADPVRFLFQHRLEAKFASPPSLPEDREPFELAGLDKYILAQRLVEMDLAGRSGGEYREAALASGQLPHGAVGDYAYRTLAAGVRQFTEQVHPFLNGKKVFSREVDLQLAGFRISGSISLCAGELVHFRYAGLKIKDHLRLWITQLALQVVEQDAAATAILLGRDESWRYHAPANAAEILALLLANYWEGLQKPLKLFPLASWKYGETVFGAGKSRSEGLQAAIGLWHGGADRPGEGAQPYYRLCFGDQEPIDEEFENLAETMLRPLFSARERL